MDCIEGIQGEIHTKFQSENHNTRDNSEDLGIDGKTLLKWISRETEFEDVDCIQVAQGKVQRWALVNMIIKFWFP